MKKITFALLIFILALLVSCEREEGCLDPSASNFSPGADKDCGSECCEYPKLDLRLFPTNNGSSFNLSDTLSDSGGNLFIMSNLQFYMSDVRLVRGDGSEVGVRDSINLILNTGNRELVSDNYVLAQINTFAYEVGEIAGSGDFESIKFNVGLDETANQVIADTIAESHPLSIENGMYADASTGYYFNKTDLTIVPDTLTTSYGITGIDNLQAITLDFDSTIVVTKGFDIEIQLDVNYPGFFDTVDFINDPENIIQEKIVINTPNVFSVR